ncbi:MAG: ABC-type transport auxiliary lipoprotein family protein [Parvibaculum sp.]
MLDSAKKLSRVLMMAVIAAWISGCALASVASEDAPSIFVLTTPVVDFGAAPTMLPLQIVVDEPYAPAALNANRIVFQPSANEIGYLGGARWSDRVPLMVQVLLVDALDRSGRFQAVGRKAVGMRSDYLVRVSVTSFGVLKGDGEADKVVVDFKTQLVRRFSDDIVAAERFYAEAVPSSSRTIDIVGAFDSATSEALSRLSVWLYKAAADAETGASGT